MNYELISEADYASLPKDNEECFATFEAICRRNMTAIIAQSKDDRGTEQEVRSQYMAAVSAVASECGIRNLEADTDYDYNTFYEVFTPFQRAVHGEIAHIRVRGRGIIPLYSVQLAPNTRTKIEFHIDHIRMTIDTSDLSNDRKKTLSDKLDELAAELANPRLGFGKTMAVLSALLVGMAAATTVAAEGPAAVTNIMKLISIDKESEDAARLRLAPPQKALSPPAVVTASRGGKSPSWNAPKGGDLDDDIPF